MTHPSATERHLQLRALAGTFSARETLAPSPWDPQGGTATARTVSRMDLSDLFLITDYQQFRGEEVTFRGHGVYGYDPETDRYSMYWFDSMTGGGFIVPARGTWVGDTLVFQREGPTGHGRYTYVVGEKGYEFKMEHSPDGETWNVLMTSVYQREPT